MNIFFQALREELIRQEKLEQLAARFNRKAGMRETWLSENQRLVSQDNFGFDLAAVEAAAKKHEAIETDIFAYEERVQAVISVASGILLLLFFIFRMEFKSNSNRIRISIEMTEI